MSYSDRPYACPYCHAEYPDREDLIDHLVLVEQVPTPGTMA